MVVEEGGQIQVVEVVIMAINFCVVLVVVGGIGAG
jgi:hypothetical protein